MKKLIGTVFIILFIYSMSGCASKDKLTTNLGPASDGTDSNISGSIYENGDAWSKTENRLEKGDSNIKETITFDIMGKEYELKYKKSEWNLGVGWVDIYITENHNQEVSLLSETGEIITVYDKTYIHTSNEDYIPSEENGTTVKTEEEFEELAKKYLQEIFGEIKYDRYTLTRDFDLQIRDHGHGSLVRRDPAEYSLDMYINGIRTGEHIGVNMNIYGDFVACSRKNIGAYDDLDVDYLIETGLLTDKACEVAGETIKEKYKEYGKEVTEVTYDTDQDVFCLDEDGKPIRIVHCHITLENGDTDSRRVVVGIEE